jgi:excisionase family DNA binding protein
LDDEHKGTILGHCNEVSQSAIDTEAEAKPTSPPGKKSRYPFPLKNQTRRKRDDQRDSKSWLTAVELAEYMGTSVGSIRNMVWRRQITAYKPFGVLLFKKAEIDRLIEASRLGRSHEED